MTQYTPGSWQVDDSRERFRNTVIHRNGSLIAKIPNVIYPNSVDREANARLIAAAPELLEALQEALNDAETMQEPYRNEAICERMRAAIAKAEGVLS